MIHHRWSALQQRIHAACQKAGRPINMVRLLAVSKFQSVDKIQEIAALGQVEFAENYPQELIAKAKQMAGAKISFVFIGSLQSNKIKILLPWISEIQTLADRKHARLIHEGVLQAQREPMPIWIQVNFFADPGKSGILPQDLAGFYEEIRGFSGINVQGVMAIPDLATSTRCSQEPGFVPDSFFKLKKIAATIGLGKLSLGMSADLEAAIIAGSDCVRIGSDLFGPRTDVYSSPFKMPTRREEKK